MPARASRSRTTPSSPSVAADAPRGHCGRWSRAESGRKEERARVQITFSLDEGALSSVRQDPETFTRELRIAAAVKWYEMRRISQGRAAEIAGLSRAEFLDALGRYEVSPFQETIADLSEALGGNPR